MAEIHTFKSTLAAVSAEGLFLCDGDILWVPSEAGLAIMVERTAVAVSPRWSGNAFEVREGIDWERVPRSFNGGTRNYRRNLERALAVAGDLPFEEELSVVELQPGDRVLLNHHNYTLLRPHEDGGWVAVSLHDKLHRLI